MIELLDALRALKDHRTTAAAAVRLRITQSAVSKRLAALEAQCGGPVVERQGRGLRLTPLGERLLRESAPHLLALAEILRPPAQEVSLRLGAPESLLGSWLPALLRDTGAEHPTLSPPIRLELHVHRGPWLVERVRSGALDLAICVDAVPAGSLTVSPLWREPMALVGLPDDLPGGLSGDLPPVWTIEAASLTGQWLAQWMDRHADRPEHAALVRAIRAGRRLESFGPLVQLARAGFAPALVPVGMAEAMQAAHLPVAGLARPICLIARSGVLARPGVEAWAQRLREAPVLYGAAAR